MGICGQTFKLFSAVVAAVLGSFPPVCAYAQSLALSDSEDARSRASYGNVLWTHKTAYVPQQFADDDLGAHSASGERRYGVSTGRHSSLFGYVGDPALTSLGSYGSYMHWLSPVSDTQLRLADWLSLNNAAPSMFTVGYSWRRLTLESSASASGESKKNMYDPDPLKAGFSSNKLSYKPTSNLELKLVRRQLSNLDQLEANDGLRRTALAATYNHALSDGSWETTVAWGRSARKEREATNGYLLESVVRLNNAHTFFGRSEQVGSDALFREDGGTPREFFTLNKVTAGYFYDMGNDLPIKLDVGVLVQKYRVPSSRTPVYGNDPMSYTVFARFRLK